MYYIINGKAIEASKLDDKRKALLEREGVVPVATIPQAMLDAIEVANIQSTYKSWKLAREQLVKNIEVTYNGVVYQGDEDSQGRMSRAILALPDTVTTINWIAKNNTIVPLNANDLKTILFLSGQAQSLIWNEGRPQNV